MEYLGRFEEAARTKHLNLENHLFVKWLEFLEAWQRGTHLRTSHA